MSKIILKESQLHRVINETVKQILKEYEWNGRTPEQDQASINAANKPASWKSTMQRVQNKRNNGQGWDSNLINKANQQLRQQYNFNNGRDEELRNQQGDIVNNTLRGDSKTYVSPEGGRIGVNQGMYTNNGYGQRYHERNYGNTQSNTNFGNGSQGNNRQTWGNNSNGSMSLNNYTNNEPQNIRGQRYFPMSKEFQQNLNNMSNDMDDYYSGNYQQRMNQKKQQLGNKGIY